MSKTKDILHPLTDLLEMNHPVLSMLASAKEICIPFVFLGLVRSDARCKFQHGAPFRHQNLC